MEKAGEPRTPRERAERRVGSTLLKWRLDALLGVGGMAAVYAGSHLKNKSRVALKVLHRELSASHDIRERFLREAYVANSVEHEGAVEVREDYLTEQDEPVLVMELLRGKTLDQMQAERGKLTALEVLGHAAQLLDVLAAAHDKGIIHRDIKPQNVFVTLAGRVKVLDFGVARMLEGAPTATATGSLLGTPAFMPPEQASGRTSAICAQSDLWSTGATMFTLLTGRFVHEAENAQAHTIKAAVTHARSLAALLPDAPKALVDLVDRALKFEIADRWDDARAMRAAAMEVRASLAEDEDDDQETKAFPKRSRATPEPAAPPVPAKPADAEANAADWGEAATSVVVVPAPAFPSRPSNAGAPPAPPPPRPSRPTSGRATAEPDAATEPSPFEMGGRTVPLSVFQQQRAAAQTAPLQNPAEAERPSVPGPIEPLPADASTAVLGGALPPGPADTLGATAPLTPAPLVPPPPEATSISAQSISQALSPHPKKRARVGRPELLAIGGALLAALVVVIFIGRAVLGGDRAPEPGSALAAETAPPAPTPAPSADDTTSATASPIVPATAEPAPADAPSATEAPSTTAAPSAAPSPYRPPTVKSIWKPKKKPPPPPRPTGR